MTEMISPVINMLLSLHDTVLTHNLAFQFIYLFCTWSESLYGFLRDKEAKILDPRMWNFSRP